MRHGCYHGDAESGLHPVFPVLPVRLLFCSCLYFIFYVVLFLLLLVFCSAPSLPSSLLHPSPTPTHPPFYLSFYLPAVSVCLLPCSHLLGIAPPFRIESTPFLNAIQPKISKLLHTTIAHNRPQRLVKPPAFLRFPFPPAFLHFPFLPSLSCTSSCLLVTFRL